ncbi:Claudin-19 [Collichthys lucidus]|uniref:Claudin n=1 Tax=Collichthys lucidus TaxID=240159 RepID=A0A4V6ANY3_COLLU|nr:Claudin-19 [Collichthys lucidus]
MASSGLQLLGFFLTLVGLAATLGATLMVEWKKEGKTNYIYEGLWASCHESGHDTVSCEYHDSVLELHVEFLVTRVVMLLSILLSSVALLISIVGMKCTHFMDGRPKGKSATAMAGGILFMIAGLMTISVTSCFEFGIAVYVSWAGGILTMAGGALLSCRRCWRTRDSESISGNGLFPASNQNSNYV